jgi:hypothetical protein
MVKLFNHKISILIILNLFQDDILRVRPRNQFGVTNTKGLDL